MISIIIPTYNEAAQIAQTIAAIHKARLSQPVEIIISDGGSNDKTMEIASAGGAIIIRSSRKGRAAQMNLGASLATHPLLYFLHADSIPPPDFASQIIEAGKQGVASGCFRLAFDYDHWFLKANAWFTRFNVNALRFGDQSLFTTKEVFERSGGFKETLMIMEDQEIIMRLKKQGSFKVLKAVVTTSARKYLDNGIYKMQGIFFRIWAMYYLGYSQERMLTVYKKLIRKHKL